MNDQAYFSNRDLAVIYASLIIRLAHLVEKTRALELGQPEISGPVIAVADECASVVERVKRELIRRGCDASESVGYMDKRIHGDTVH